MKDVRFAIRSLIKHRGFAALAVATLALGIGANTAVFSVIQAVLLRPLPYPEPERLVRIRGLQTRTGEIGNLSPADFLDFEAQSTSFEGMGAHGWVGFFTVSGSGQEPERVGGVNVTSGFFPTLGVTPMLGRLFRPEEDQPGGPLVVILSHGFWQRRYGGDPAVVGRAILVNARPATVIGVLPAGFKHTNPNPEREAEIFVPYQFDRVHANRGGHFIYGVGRLKAHVSVAAAEAELRTLAAGLERLHPEHNTDRSVTVQPLHEAIVGGSRTALLILLAAVGLVLLVACANVANLLLARGAARQKEIAIRASLGAGRGRLLRQLLMESIVLSAAGAMAGLVVAGAAMRLLTLLAAADVPLADDLRLDGGVLLFTLSATIGTAVIVGLVPALQISRVDILEGLKEGLPGRSHGPVRHGLRNMLIAAEVSLTISLLIGAGLLLRSFWKLEAVSPGFAPRGVLTMQIALPTAVYPEGDQVPFYERLLEQVEALPGVRAAGAVNILPLTDNYDSRGIQIEDYPQPQGREPSIQARSVTPGYFPAMGIPLLRGRLFDGRDTPDSPPVVVVSESMARRFWHGEDALGKRITFNSGIPQELQQDVGGPGSRLVIGIVGDVKHLELDEGEAIPFFYTPHTQQPSYHTMTLVVRAAGDAATLTSAIRDRLASLDRNVPLYQAQTLDTVLYKAVAGPRLRTLLLGAFAALGLALSLVGVYGVVSYIVSLRSHEVGIRLALGARQAPVVRLLVIQGMGPVALGIVAGMAASAAMSRLLASLLYRVTPVDAVTFGTVPVLVAATATLAAFFPALRKARMDPTQALRSE